MPITLVPNPSHLEFVNPVVEGHARAVQENRSKRGEPDQDARASLPILIHGDAAFIGQGVVAETLNLSSLEGYRTDGTIHIIVNNQIGFTTLPKDGRSTLYASDLAKGYEIPILHVSADDPVACIVVARMAHAYRERFHKDILIDLIGYRRYGHNEGDDPAFTQPRMYEKIGAHPRVREIFAKRLEEEGVITRDESEAMVRRTMEQLRKARNTPPLNGKEEISKPRRSGWERDHETAVSAENLRRYNTQMLLRPEGFTVNAKQDRNVFGRRRDGLEQGRIDWGHAESLAFASILADGTPIRLTGQDAERGTFTQRHAVLYDPTDGTRYVPLQAMEDARAAFAVYNSPLSEAACLGFEYGYSMHAPGVLVLWEAQFGDFCNGAQVIIDQFLTSGQAKWEQTPSLVLLLPHGYEGQGPEHSSARLERFLQLCADDNIRVVNCTTAAQYFHLLRKQAKLLETDPRPLVVMTPKRLLRDVNAVSTLEELARGTFQPVMDDPWARSRAESVTRLVLCSGKVYMDLVYQNASSSNLNEAFANASHLAAVRVEQLYPFPAEAIRRVAAGYPNLRELVWMQEEPQNMGAWTYVEPRLRALFGREWEPQYAGRPASASPAEGSHRRHVEAQNRLITEAIGAPIERPLVSVGKAVKTGAK